MALPAEERTPQGVFVKCSVRLDFNRINSLAYLGLPRRVPCNDYNGGSISSGKTEIKVGSSIGKEESVRQGSVPSNEHTGGSILLKNAITKKDLSLLKEGIQQGSRGLVAAGKGTLASVDCMEARKRKAERNASSFQGDPPAKQAIGRPCPTVPSSLAPNKDQLHKAAISTANDLLDIQDKENYKCSRQEPRTYSSLEKRRLQVSTRLQNGACQRRIGSLLVKPANPRVQVRGMGVHQSSPFSLAQTSKEENAGQALTMEVSQAKARLTCWQDAQECATDTEVGASVGCLVVSITPVTACSITIGAASAPLATVYTDENAQASTLQSKYSSEKNDSVLAHGSPMRQSHQSSTSSVLSEQRSVVGEHKKPSLAKAALLENRVPEAGQERAIQDAISSHTGASKLIQHLHISEKKKPSAENASFQTKKQGENEHFVWVNGRRYQKLKKIGRGGSSEVYKVIDREGDIYALKRIKLKGRDYATAMGFYQEIELLTRLEGKSYIIRLIDHEVTDKELFGEEKDGSYIIRHDANIYMLLEHGEVDLATMLQDKLKERAQGENEVDETWLRYYWQQIVEAVNMVHEERILHADLKPANFLLVKGVLKLIDFGIAKSIQNDTTNIERVSQVGTLNYMSPEAFLMNEKDEHGNVIKCNRSSDIWALGCILYQMVYGKTPFAHVTALHAKIQEVANPNHHINYSPVSNPHLVDIMKRCLAYKREDRLRIPELMNHPFLQPCLVQSAYSKKVEDEICLQLHEENRQGRDAAAFMKLLERVKLL